MHVRYILNTNRPSTTIRPGVLRTILEDADSDSVCKSKKDSDKKSVRKRGRLEYSVVSLHPVLTFRTRDITMARHCSFVAAVALLQIFYCRKTNETFTDAFIDRDGTIFLEVAELPSIFSEVWTNSR